MHLFVTLRLSLSPPALPLLTQTLTAHSDTQNYKVACVLRYAIQQRGLTLVYKHILYFFSLNFTLPLIWRFTEHVLFAAGVCYGERALHGPPFNTARIGTKKGRRPKQKWGKCNLKERKPQKLVSFTYRHSSSTCTPMDWNLVAGGGGSSFATGWRQSTLSNKKMQTETDTRTCCLNSRQ